jgi:hypothetical protein
MPTSIQKYRDPFALGEVPVSVGGANEITIVRFPGAPEGLTVTVRARVNTVVLQITTIGDEGDTIAEPRWTIPAANGFEIPGGGWGREGDGAQIRIAADTQNAVVEFMVARK